MDDASNAHLDAIKRTVLARMVREGEIELGAGGTTAESIGQPLQSQEIHLHRQHIPVRGGVINVNLSLHQSERNGRMIAIVDLGDQARVYELPREGYSQEYNKIREKLLRGNYRLSIDSDGGIDLSLD